MTYEKFKQLAEHPQHRAVPAIIKLEVLETEELEEKDRIFRQAHDCSFSNKEQIEKLKSAAASAVAKSSRHPKSQITSLMSRLQPNVPSAISIP